MHFYHQFVTVGGKKRNQKTLQDTLWCKSKAEAFSGMWSIMYIFKHIYFYLYIDIDRYRYILCSSDVMLSSPSGMTYKNTALVPLLLGHPKTSANVLLKFITTAQEEKSQVLKDFRAPCFPVVFLFLFFILYQLKALWLDSLLFSLTTNSFLCF